MLTPIALFHQDPRFIRKVRSFLFQHNHKDDEVGTCKLDIHLQLTEGGGAWFCLDCEGKASGELVVLGIFLCFGIFFSCRGPSPCLSLGRNSPTVSLISSSMARQKSLICKSIASAYLGLRATPVLMKSSARFLLKKRAHAQTPRANKNRKF
ncbi:hypothetical protein BJ741DRAFT_637136 [Chytriomyces cf. hyalinus JEL632]|nr:hypothetical protein BJ741DRAFT_637136 [Chytriomyces cf. hyalinus JEL632]